MKIWPIDSCACYRKFEVARADGLHQACQMPDREQEVSLVGDVRRIGFVYCDTTIKNDSIQSLASINTCFSENSRAIIHST